LKKNTDLILILLEKHIKRVKKTMTDYIKEYEFKNPPKEITYLDEEPLKLTKEFSFFHNKSKFRKELNRLQYLFKSYLKTPLIAAGIRDTYLKEEYTEKYYILLFTTSEVVREANKIIEKRSKIDIPSGCFLIETNPKYLVLLAMEMDGIISGIDKLEEIFNQTFEDYFNRKEFDEFIKIRPFKMSGCATSS